MQAVVFRYEQSYGLPPVGDSCVPTLLRKTKFRYGSIMAMWCKSNYCILTMYSVSELTGFITLERIVLLRHVSFLCLDG
jgi:hypothetical protein